MVFAPKTCAVRCAPLFFAILTAACGIAPTSTPDSITGPDYTGKKNYFGWAEVLDGFMGNEVRFDVKHSHDIFAGENGGKYQGEYLINRAEVTGDRIKATIERYATTMGENDMYVQYSGGHGSTEGLAVGLTYADVVDRILKTKAKEVVIFMMACHSGGLVAEFDKRKSEWEGWRASGRTLFVMSSSKHDENSSTGPSTDTGEPISVDGSAGSAFGFNLWKALSGEADGFGGTTKDGKVTLGEIRDYATAKTLEQFGHTPQVTGVYDDGLVMTLPSTGTQPSAEVLAAVTAFETAAAPLKTEIAQIQPEFQQAQTELRTVNDEIALVVGAEVRVKIEALQDRQGVIFDRLRELQEAAGNTLNRMYTYVDKIKAAAGGATVVVTPGPGPGGPGPSVPGTGGPATGGPTPGTGATEDVPPAVQQEIDTLLAELRANGIALRALYDEFDALVTGDTVPAALRDRQTAARTKYDSLLERLQTLSQKLEELRTPLQAIADAWLGFQPGTGTP